jgi:hypothetical protein
MKRGVACSMHKIKKKYMNFIIFTVFDEKYKLWTIHELAICFTKYYYGDQTE